MSDYLYHHGILGQKWGVRRYQNEDGTLTDLGKTRNRGELRKASEARRSLIKTYKYALNDRDIEHGKQIVTQMLYSEDRSRLNEHLPSQNPKYKNLSQFKTKVKTYDNGYTLVDYIDDGRTIAQFDIDSSHTIWGIKVDPSYRGCGLGSQLIKEAVHKYCGDSLHVMLDNEIAIKMYSDHGFEFGNNFYRDNDGNLTGQMFLKNK